MARPKWLDVVLAVVAVLPDILARIDETRAPAPEKHAAAVEALREREHVQETQAVQETRDALIESQVAYLNALSAAPPKA